MEDVNDIEVVLNEAFVLIMLVKWETQANAQTQTGVRLLMMSVFVLIVSLLWFMAVSITCTYLGRKSTKESIPEVAQSEGKVFVEEIPAIYHNVRLINIVLQWKFQHWQ